MNIRHFINRIRNKPSSQLELTDEVVLKFLNTLEQLGEREISCNEIYSMLDEFVENEVSGENAHKLAPLIRDHMDICPDCCDEYKALLSVVEHTKGDTIN